MPAQYCKTVAGQMTLVGRAGDSARPPDIHTNTTKIRSVILSLPLHARRKRMDYSIIRAGTWYK